MNCDEAKKSVPLMLYGELSFEEEELVQQHLDVCGECRAEEARQRSLFRLMDQRELEPSPFLLRACRQSLEGKIEQANRDRGFFGSFGQDLRRMFSGSWMPRFTRPVGAVALIAVGFFGARITPMLNRGGVQSAALFDPSSSRVRYVEPGPKGEIQVVVDETRQHTVSGNLNDQRIRALLLSAARDESDPGLRVETVDILKSEPGSDDVRGALIYALEHDTNPGVRLKALEGLKAFAGQADVRSALSQVLLTDNNPGLRTQAIDLLTQNSQEQQIVGVLQELMRKEDNSYIRLRCQKALHQMNASVDAY